MDRIKVCRCGNPLERSETKAGRPARWRKYCSDACRAEAYKEASPTTVYTFYDSDGSALYVGVTADFKARSAAHRFTRSWWGEVASSEVDHLPNRLLALAREAELIQTLRPKYNVVIPSDLDTEPVNNRKRISLWVPDELAEAIDAEAARAQRTRNDYLVKFLTRALSPGVKAQEKRKADAVTEQAFAEVPDTLKAVSFRSAVPAPLPCRCGGVIYQVGVKKGKCSLCSKPVPA